MTTLEQVLMVGAIVIEPFLRMSPMTESIPLASRLGINLDLVIEAVESTLLPIFISLSPVHDIMHERFPSKSGVV